MKCNAHAQNGKIIGPADGLMLRGVLREEVVLALVFKPCTICTQVQQNGAIINNLFMTKFELCCLKNKDENDDDYKMKLRFFAIPVLVFSVEH